MRSHPLFNPAAGKFSPLALRWSSDQLETIVWALAPLIQDSSTPEMMDACASVARSVIVEHALTGQPLRFARSKDHYSLPKRYREHDRLYTWHYVTNSVARLEAAGLVNSFRGLWGAPGRGFQSIVCPTESLLEGIGHLVDVGEQRAIEGSWETIVLRDDHRRLIDYEDSDETSRLRAEMSSVNEALTARKLLHRGRNLPMPPCRRIFNGSMERGGRLYASGTSHQNMPTADRLKLQLQDAWGEMQPVVEVDFRALHISMAYAERGLNIPAGDPYLIDGFERQVVKDATNIMLNARNRSSAIRALATDFRKSKDPALEVAESPSDYAKMVVSAVEERHPMISECFGTDCGARFQRKDSDMTVAIMSRFLDERGECPLPIHDSYLVCAQNADALESIMVQTAEDFGIHLEVVRKCSEQ